MSNRLTDIFEDEALVKKIQTRLPYLFQIAELESSRAGKIGMQVGSLRETIVVSLLIHKFGEQNIETEIVTIQVHLPKETKVLPMRIAYLAERATKNLSVLHFLLDSVFLLCYLFWPWEKSWSYRDER